MIFAQRRWKQSILLVIDALRTESSFVYQFVRCVLNVPLPITSRLVQHNRCLKINIETGMFFQLWHISSEMITMKRPEKGTQKQ